MRHTKGGGLVDESCWVNTSYISVCNIIIGSKFQQVAIQEMKADLHKLLDSRQCHFCIDDVHDLIGKPATKNLFIAFTLYDAALLSGARSRSNCKAILGFNCS